MSLVQIAYQTILTKIRDHQSMSRAQLLEVFQQASSLMGSPFRSALSLFEKHPETITITDYQLYYLIQVGMEKVMVFKSHSRARLNDCSCKKSWARKVGEKAPLMCMHQVVLELALTVFKGEIMIKQA